MKSEIAVIAPDKELLSLVKEVEKEIDEPITVVNGYLDQGIDVAKELIEQGVKVLVSRGGTTNKLRQAKIPLPIIDIPITEYDIIKLLDQARTISKRIAVIGFDSLIKGAEDIAPILNVTVEKFLVSSGDEVREKVQLAKRKGVDVIVGAKLATDYAKSLGLHGILLKSQKPAVLAALNEAAKVLQVLRREREWGEQLKTILDSIHEGIIFVDKYGKVIHLNNMAGRVIDIKNKDAVGRSIHYFINDKTIIGAIQKGEKWIGEVRDFDNIKYVCGLNPIAVDDKLIGSIISFQELSHLQTIEYKVRRKLNPKGHVAKYCFNDIIRESYRIEQLIMTAKQYAEVDSTVLIIGESGTGKEMFAQSLHNASTRRGEPFVAINCAALPENLLESELFGYVEGAFTGAKKGGKIGLFELAHGGTLFLDEIGEISAAVQARLLRVLEERQVMRLGDDKIIPVDVRIFCATNKDLQLLIKKGKFREDLFYRINILKLEIPPLRERKEDIPILVQFFSKYFSGYFQKKQPVFTPEAMSLLIDYKWPGNIRELKNVIERLIITTKDNEVSYVKVIDVLDKPMDSGDPFQELNIINWSKSVKSPPLLEQEELKLIMKVMKETSGNKAETARRLGISKSTLWRKLKKISK
ncbi:MAG: sigma 54-interacting transcriptional regulator [Bacillota bacterium]